MVTTFQNKETEYSGELVGRTLTTGTEMIKKTNVGIALDLNTSEMRPIVTLPSYRRECKEMDYIPYFPVYYNYYRHRNTLRQYLPIITIIVSTYLPTIPPTSNMLANQADSNTVTVYSSVDTGIQVYAHKCIPILHYMHTVYLRTV